MGVHCLELLGSFYHLPLEAVQLQMAQEGLIELFLKKLGQYVFNEHLLVLDDNSSQVVSPTNGMVIGFMIKHLSQFDDEDGRPIGISILDGPYLNLTSLLRRNRHDFETESFKNYINKGSMFKILCRP